ncbi:DUF3221 domain-containing protein [Senegalia massiliensis]|nr:DUF3221 domain-containing protein [Senegalia massiliensis]
MKKLIFTLLILYTILFFVGCTEEMKNEAIGIRGEIEKIEANNTSSYTIYVEGKKESDTEYDKASVYVDSNTTIYDGTKKVNIEDLEEGLMVEIIFEGGVRESYPVQADAKKIYILDEKI